MEDKPGLLDFAMTLWEDGTLLAGAEGKGSLYLYQNEYYVIYYTSDNFLNNIEKVDEKRAMEIIREDTGS